MDGEARARLERLRTFVSLAADEMEGGEEPLATVDALLADLTAMDGEAIEARARALLAEAFRANDQRDYADAVLNLKNIPSFVPLAVALPAIVAALTPKPSAEMRESVARIMFDIGSQRLGIGDDPWESAGASVQDEYLKDADAILSSPPIVAEREVIERETIERCAKVADQEADRWRRGEEKRCAERLATAIRSLTPTEKRDVE